MFWRIINLPPPLLVEFCAVQSHFPEDCMLGDLDVVVDSLIDCRVVGHVLVDLNVVVDLSIDVVSTKEVEMRSNHLR